MAKSLLVGSLFAAAALASPLEERTLNCNAVNNIVSILHEQRVATPFCSSLLNIPTVTKTCTETSTPPCTTLTTVSGNAATVTTVSTSVVYGTTTVYPVVAVSTISTCAIGQTFIPSTTPAATRLKRGSPPPPGPAGPAKGPPTSTAIGTPNCLSSFIGSKVTSACSCLNIPTPTSVTVTTTTLPVKTITKIVSNTIAQTVTSVLTSTSFTSTYSATQVYTSTFTVLPEPTSTISLPDGEVYGVYNDLDFAGQDIQNFFCYPDGPAPPSPYPSCSSFNDCVSECAYYNDNNLGGTTKCGTVVYNTAPDGSSASCYLKTGQTGCGSPNSQTDTGVLLPLIPNDVQ